MTTLDLDSGAGTRRVDLAEFLDPLDEERAHEAAYAWIKAVRHANVDGVPFRRRFTFRGDSLWWFAELFLHKEQAILNVHRMLAAFNALVDRERPLAVRYVAGRLPGVLAAAAQSRSVRYEGPGWEQETVRLAKMDARSRALSLAARLSRLRTGSPPAGTARLAAFVHRAFWRSERADGSAESYIGPTLRALEDRIPREQIRFVAVGPATNFRARKWWHPIRAGQETAAVPIERYAPASALTASRALFRQRHAIRRTLWSSEDLRAHAVIGNCDCWPLVREQLAGVALLQFPWSARAMDESAAALDVLQPRVAVTYAEAGGWGRALALECRRRGIPLAGLQHGFIYRHWLNYRHEPDETAPDAEQPSDRGFPFPAVTLLFDEHAESHLLQAGRCPRESLAVTGSARFDELKAAVAATDQETIARTRDASGADASRALVLFASKEREARAALPALVDAVRAMPDVQLAIKPHPAETPEVYSAIGGAAPNIRVLPLDVPLASLLATARAVVTVNSTVAIDARAMGIPAVVIGLPNNLSPFVDSGRMIGASSAGEIRTALAKVLYDEKFRTTTGTAADRAQDRQAAARAADAILQLAAK